MTFQSIWGALTNIGNDTDTTVTTNTVFVTASVGSPSVYRFRGLTINSGVTATFGQNDAIGTSYAAVVLCNGDVTINGTINTSFVVSIPGAVPAFNWDGATSGGAGSAVAGGTAGTAAATTPTIDQLLHGDETQTDLDYRRFYIYEQWKNAGGGGTGYGIDTAIGGFPAGAIVIVAKGKITMGSSGTIAMGGIAGQTSISVNPAGGGGGGGGGLVGLISYHSIVIPSGAVVDASGGAGGWGNPAGSFLYVAGGGGGGGGTIMSAAPVVTVGGTLNVAGGMAGIGTPGRGRSGVYGGGGGGGSIGAGGRGGHTALPGPATPGAAGVKPVLTGTVNLGLVA